MPENVTNNKITKDSEPVARGLFFVPYPAVIKKNRPRRMVDGGDCYSV